MPAQTYEMTEESLAIFDKHWKNREASTTPHFYNKMNVIQKELIELHYKKMDTDSKIRSHETLIELNKKINEFNEKYPPHDHSTEPNEVVKHKSKPIVEVLSSEEITKVIEIVDNLLENIDDTKDSPLEIEPKPKSTRPKGRGGRNTKAISDVP